MESHPLWRQKIKMSEDPETYGEQQEQAENIKLKKMSKGYQWEIKTLDMDVERLEKINNQIKEKFENEETKDKE